MRLISIILLALAIGGAAIACDDDEGGSGTARPLEAYYDGLSGIGSDFLDELDRAPLGIDPQAPIADQVDVYEVYTRGLGDDLRAARDGLQDLDAPTEVADAHQDLFAAVENAVAVAEGLENEIGEINTSEDLQRIATSTEVTEALAQFQTACVALRDIASEQNIDTVLRCE